ncbi:MAG TPA: hypothetical protein VED46_19010 [Alphaproteobacteria bacterium]|nr:hypothetical protein [Alphaproteobacteria bacterium]
MQSSPGLLARRGGATGRKISQQDQRITDNPRDWLDEWKTKEPEAEAPMMWDGEPITAIK